MLNSQTGNGVFFHVSRQRGVIYSHTVEVILCAIGDRYSLAVKIYRAEMIDGIDQYSIFTIKFQNGRQNGR